MNSTEGVDEVSPPASLPDASSPAGSSGTEPEKRPERSPSSPDEENARDLLKTIEADEDLSILADMIQTTQFHHPHHRAFQVGINRFF